LILNNLIQKEFNNTPVLLLGELQFCFVTFLLGENFDSFEQWKSLTTLLCQCREALQCEADGSSSNPTAEMFFRFIPVVYA